MTKTDRAVIDRRNNPFIMVTRKVIEDPTLRASDKSVYTTLCMYADNETAEAWPSRDTLMKKSGVSDNTLRRSLKELSDKGYIEVVERFGSDGRQLSNLYILNSV